MGHELAHPIPVPMMIKWPLPMMTRGITVFASCHDVFLVNLTAILRCNQVLGSALECLRLRK